MKNLYLKQASSLAIESHVQGFIADKMAGVKQKPWGFMTVLENEGLIQEIVEFAKEARQKWQKFIVCGIGGSALGARAVAEACLKTDNLLVLDSIDPDTLEKVAEQDLSQTLFFFISKSGGTLETASQFFFFRDVLKKRGLNWQEHSIMVTGKEGIFRDIANEENLKTFPVPEETGGRFSVLTPVGLLPLACAGVDIEQLIEGAKSGREAALSENVSENIALRLASAEFLGKKHSSVMFLYADKLEYIGRFWRQLLGESVGKTKDIGILPHVAIGTRDQHSDLQLFAEGPDDKLYTFIGEKKVYDLVLPQINHSAFPYLSEQKFSNLVQASMRGTAQSLEEKGRDVQILEITEVNEYALGELILTMEAEIAFLGEMFEINAFDQPGVEAGKKITKKILSDV